MMPFPTSFTQHLGSLPPLEHMSKFGREAVTILSSKGYEVGVGLTLEYADAISAMAKEPSIQEYCPNDSAARFIDRETAARWLSGGRAIFLLLHVLGDGSKQLAGYGWLGTKQSPHLPGSQTTFSLRIGESHQGKGLAAPFSKLIIEAGTLLYGAPNLWLETWASNVGAVHVYHKIGFKTVKELNAQRPSANDTEVPDIRLYMRLDDDILSPRYSSA